jgi:hypothetical protein
MLTATSYLHETETYLMSQMEVIPVTLEQPSFRGPQKLTLCM